jgi:hypothetical protein
VKDSLASERVPSILADRSHRSSYQLVLERSGGSSFAYCSSLYQRGGRSGAADALDELESSHDHVNNSRNNMSGSSLNQSQGSSYSIEQENYDDDDDEEGEDSRSGGREDDNSYDDDEPGENKGTGS